MLRHPNIDPVIFSIWELKIRWYSLSYIAGFLLAYFLGKHRAKQANSGWTTQEVSDLIFNCAVGLVVGARVGYILFYNAGAMLDNFWVLFKVWEGGMSFHGGLIGVILAAWLFGRKTKKGFFGVTDFLVPLAPLGIFCGRMANFINAELWGRKTDVAWGMEFPIKTLDPSTGQTTISWTDPRHASQLYEGFLEGIVLFIILWIYSSKPRPAMAVSAVFLIFYGLFRTFVEFFREPDAHIEFVAFNWLTMGQLLSAPMIIAGLTLLFFAYKMEKKKT